MSHLTFDLPATGIHKPEKSHETQGKESPKKWNKTNVLALAFYYLVESASTSAETAIVQAKQLQANSSAQQELNREAEALKWVSVPKLDGKHHTEFIDPHGHWTWSFWRGGFHYKTYKKVTYTTFKNQVTVSNREAHNQQVSAERSTLTQEMSVLQQTAKIRVTRVNSINDVSAQTMKEGSMLNNVLQSLTFKALMTPPPQ